MGITKSGHVVVIMYAYSQFLYISFKDALDNILTEFF